MQAIILRVHQREIAQETLFLAAAMLGGAAAEGPVVGDPFFRIGERGEAALGHAKLRCVKTLAAARTLVHAEIEMEHFVMNDAGDDHFGNPRVVKRAIDGNHALLHVAERERMRPAIARPAQHTRFERALEHGLIDNLEEARQIINLTFRLMTGLAGFGRGHRLRVREFNRKELDLLGDQHGGQAGHGVESPGRFSGSL